MTQWLGNERRLVLDEDGCAASDEIPDTVTQLFGIGDRVRVVGTASRHFGRKGAVARVHHDMSRLSMQHWRMGVRLDPAGDTGSSPRCHRRCRRHQHRAGQ